MDAGTEAVAPVGRDTDGAPVGAVELPTGGGTLGDGPGAGPALVAVGATDARGEGWPPEQQHPTTAMTTTAARHHSVRGAAPFIAGSVAPRS